MQRLAQYGVGYRSLTEQYLDSCGIFKDAVLSILATIAKQERIRISERVHAGLAKARKQGRIGGRPRLVLNHAKVLSLSRKAPRSVRLPRRWRVAGIDSSDPERSSPRYQRCDSCLKHGVANLRSSWQPVARIFVSLFFLPFDILRGFVPLDVRFSIRPFWFSRGFKVFYRVLAWRNRIVCALVVADLLSQCRKQ